jgi:hypothetical protein
MKENFSKFPFTELEIEKIDKLPTLAQDILWFIVTNAQGKALVTSRQILANYCEKSISSVKRSVVLLKESGLIKTYQSGGFNMYIPSYVLPTLKSAEKENFLLINSVLLLSEREWGEK